MVFIYYLRPIRISNFLESGSSLFLFLIGKKRKVVCIFARELFEIELSKPILEVTNKEELLKLGYLLILTYFDGAFFVAHNEFHGDTLLRLRAL